MKGVFGEIYFGCYVKSEMPGDTQLKIRRSEDARGHAAEDPKVDREIVFGCRVKSENARDMQLRIRRWISRSCWLPCQF